MRCAARTRMRGFPYEIRLRRVARTRRRGVRRISPNPAGTRRAPRSPPTHRRPSPPTDPLPSARARSTDRCPISTPCTISISAPSSTRPCRTRCTTSGPAAEPVAGSSATPNAGPNIRVFQRSPDPAEAVDPVDAELLEQRAGRAAARRHRPRSGALRKRTPVRSKYSRPATYTRQPPARRAARRPPRTARPPARTAASRRSVPSSPVRSRERHRDHAEAGLEPDHVRPHRPADDERRPEHRMSGERELGRGREDPHAQVRLGLRGAQDEHGL